MPDWMTLPPRTDAAGGLSRRGLLAGALGLALALGGVAPAAAGATRPGGPAPRTVLGVRGTHFTRNGKPTFLLGISDFAALGEPPPFVRQDLDEIQRDGFNWLRVFATWGAFGRNISAVDAGGGPREPYLGALQRLVAACDRRGLVVDVTLARDAGGADGALPNFAAHRRAVETVVGALKGHRNWYLDLANEHDIRDGRYVPDTELKALRDLVRRLDPACPVTASFADSDLSAADLREALVTIGLDFISLHRPREADSPGQTEAATRRCLARMRAIGHPAPVHYQEPFRRGYGAWEPSASDFLTDLGGALAGGAAGWCFHNGCQDGAADSLPRRSFDLHDRRLFAQLDPVERTVVAQAAPLVRRAERGQPVAHGQPPKSPPAATAGSAAPSPRSTPPRSESP